MNSGTIAGVSCAAASGIVTSAFSVMRGAVCVGEKGGISSSASASCHKTRQRSGGELGVVSRADRKQSLMCNFLTHESDALQYVGTFHLPLGKVPDAQATLTRTSPTPDKATRESCLADVSR